MKQFLFIVLLVIPSLLYAQETVIPKWFTADLKANVGRWVADNTPYMSTEEPFESYAMEWTWGIGKTSIIGRLFGIVDGEETGDFWQFRQYWDNLNKRGVLVQFGNGGVHGMGSIQPIENGTMEAIQTFSMPNGSTWETKHELKLKGSSLLTTSFNKDAEGNWIRKRSYTWVKQ